MTKMERLSRQIHENFLRGAAGENKQLIDELLVETRMLRIYVLHVTEGETK
jgi:hypothetical protein